LKIILVIRLIVKETKCEAILDQRCEICIYLI
jgi:hypothetical protein